MNYPSLISTGVFRNQISFYVYDSPNSRPEEAVKIKVLDEDSQEIQTTDETTLQFHPKARFGRLLSTSRNNNHCFVSKKHCELDFRNWFLNKENGFMHINY